ncbi:MAG: signal peptide peptidase SppA [Deltaproteobacteria bacterium]|nr:signal peptide peptidase SppA [Candidatus Anaeroferrophillus wilburensis]MBN2889363.1 signal peptide peptidase SppA [Deltaproteobacteria bacterium]
MKKMLLILLILVLITMISIIVIGYFINTDKRSGNDQIGLIHVRGVIIDAQETIAQLDEMADDPHIKAIIIRINSPGGAVAPSQELYDEIKRIRSIKPVYSSLGTVAASGGYYVACATQKIYANPGTLTGSIGVIMQFANWEKILAKLGVDNTVVKSGPYKDIGSPLRSMSKAEEKLLQEMINDVYNQFVVAVTESRDIPLDSLLTLADGRVFSGRQAYDCGLVDTLGSLQQAVRDLAREVGIAGKPEVTEIKEKRGIVQYLLGERLAGKLEQTLECEVPIAAYLMPALKP